MPHERALLADLDLLVGAVERLGNDDDAVLAELRRRGVDDRVDAAEVEALAGVVALTLLHHADGGGRRGE